jgi:hypothetical protein
VAKLDEAEMKSAAGKEKWRNFIMKVRWKTFFPSAAAFSPVAIVATHGGGLKLILIS